MTGLMSPKRPAGINQAKANSQSHWGDGRAGPADLFARGDAQVTLGSAAVVAAVWVVP
jgi:hypothetical protein